MNMPKKMVEKLSANLIEENSEDALYKNREELRRCRDVPCLRWPNSPRP